MANGIVITNLGKNILLNRFFQETPNYTAPKYFKIGINQSTPQTNATDLDNPVEMSSGNYYKEFVSGYPSLNEVEKKSVIRCFLNTSEANGNNLNGIGIFNNDSEKKLIFLASHTAENKTAYNQFAYIFTVEYNE